MNPGSFGTLIRPTNSQVHHHSVQILIIFKSKTWWGGVGSGNNVSCHVSRTGFVSFEPRLSNYAKATPSGMKSSTTQANLVTLSFTRNIGVIALFKR